MEKAQGVKEIETAQWMKDDYGCLNLFVTDSMNRPVHAWLTMRPTYCDRGYIRLNIDGALDLDAADSFPRYFFSFLEADEHTRNFLKWRMWRERASPPDAIRTVFEKGIGGEV